MDMDQLIVDLKRDEGKRSRPYKDTLGVLTIGYGHNLTSEGLCDEALEAQLVYDIRTKAIEPLDKHLPWWRTAPPNAQRVLANLAFNMGISALLSFKRTLWFIQEGEYNDAADALLASKYASQVGDRAARLALLLRLCYDGPSPTKP